ncbi:MAG: hypothetical protein ACKVS9_02830 [Phycisphaerae bacterium]
MRRKLWKFAYESTFYLPGVDRELALLDTQAERDRARWHVWRHLFASWRYWALCIVVIAIMLPALWLAMPLSRALAAALQMRSPQFEMIFFIAYSMTLAVVFAIGGMWPLRRMVLRELRRYLRDRDIAVCLGCGYNLHGLESPRCPECGAACERV